MKRHGFFKRNEEGCLGYDVMVDSFRKIIKMNDSLLEQKINVLQSSITTWAQKNEVWGDSCFKTYFEYFEDEPSENIACVTVLCLDDPLIRIFKGMGDGRLLDEFDDLLSNSGFWYEADSDIVLTFYCEDEEMNRLYVDYFEWQWINELIKEDYTSLYQELFDYFKTNPDKLYALSPRSLEVFISEVFRNQGYQTELGSGWNDGGVDLRLYQKDAIDQIVTLVQIKRYRSDRPIGLESVAYLNNMVSDENANRGLFITTSKYLPQVKSFANRHKNKLILADSQDIAKWCESAKTHIVRDKSKVLTREVLLNLLKSRNGLEGEVVVAQVGMNIIMNQFCLIVKDSLSVSLLLKIPGRAINNRGDSHRFNGSEVPVLDETILECVSKENVFRAKKSYSADGSITFWGDKNLYSIWDGKPVYYDRFD